MESKGKFVKASLDYETRRFHITFSLDYRPSDDELEKIRTADALSITAKKWHEKRSLDANGYLWVLCTKIAEVVRSSKDEVYEEMLQKYGYLSDITVSVKSEVDMSKVAGHWKYLKTSSDGKFKAYIMIRGTSEYDRAEMAKFTDMVVQEAKELSIETLPPHEIERLLAMVDKK